MSKTKFLGIPAGGKRAGWIEMEGGSSAGVGGGGLVVNITQNGDGTYSADKTFAEVQEQIKAGNSVSAKISIGSMVYVSTTYFLNENTVVEFVVFTGVTALMSFHFLLKVSDTIEMKMYNVTATAT